MSSSQFYTHTHTHVEKKMKAGMFAYKTVLENEIIIFRGQEDMRDDR